MLAAACCSFLSPFYHFGRTVNDGDKRYHEDKQQQDSAHFSFLRCFDVRALRGEVIAFLCASARQRAFDLPFEVCAT